MLHTSFQTQGAIILQAEQAAERIAHRLEANRPTVCLSSDELAEIAQRFAAVTAIARDYHLERAAVGSLTEMPEPTA